MGERRAAEYSEVNISIIFRKTVWIVVLGFILLKSLSAIEIMNVVFNFYDCKGQRCAPPRPGKPSLAEKIQMENNMAHFGIKFNLPVSLASDVINGGSREFTISTNGVEPPVVQTLVGSAILSEQVVFNEGDSFSVSLVDIDASHNRGPSSTAFTGTVLDDVAPPAPGLITMGEKVQLD